MSGAPCIIDGCGGARLARRRMCDRHWRMLPGKTRSILSFQPLHSPITDQIWEDARLVVESGATA